MGLVGVRGRARRPAPRAAPGSAAASASRARVVRRRTRTAGKAAPEGNDAQRNRRLRASGSGSYCYREARRSAPRGRLRLRSSRRPPSVRAPSPFHEPTLRANPSHRLAGRARRRRLVGLEAGRARVPAATAASYAWLGAALAALRDRHADARRALAPHPAPHRRARRRAPTATRSPPSATWATTCCPRAPARRSRSCCSRARCDASKRTLLGSVVAERILDLLALAVIFVVVVYGALSSSVLPTDRPLVMAGARRAAAGGRGDRALVPAQPPRLRPRARLAEAARRRSARPARPRRARCCWPAPSCCGRSRRPCTWPLPTRSTSTSA